MTTLTQAKRSGCPPRYATARTPSRPTLGPRVADIAEKLGKPFMPWQRQAVDVALEIDTDTGLLAYGEVDLVVMRQNGKSETLLPVMTHRCLGFSDGLSQWIRRELGIWVPEPGPQRVLYLAQTADSARLKWRQLHKERLEKTRYTRGQFTSTLTQNKEAFTWRNGSIWSPGSSTGKTGGTGDSLDLPMVDEGWSHSQRTEIGLRPAMLTRPWAQLWVASMVPGLNRAKPNDWPYLKTKMTAGRARVDAGINTGVCYIEYSAEPGLDPGDPATWWSCMPALGYTVAEAKIREDYDSWVSAGNKIDFEAEYLGWAPSGKTQRWTTVQERTWDDRLDSASKATDPIAVGVASSPDRGVSTIALACQLDGGDVHVEIIERKSGVDWVVDALQEILESWDVCSITINPAGPEASVRDDLKTMMDDRFSTVPVFWPSLREVCAGDARLLDATGEVPEEVAEMLADDSRAHGIRLHHLGQQELTRAVAAGAKRVVGAQWQWDFTGPVDPLRAVSAAWWGGVRSEWSGSAYDIGESLG